MANTSTSSISIHDRIPLEGSDSRIPRLGYGVWKSPKDICTQSVLTALSLGYRHIDTAQLYQNEAEVGAAIKASGIPREEIFVTTKMQYPANDSVEDTLERMRRSVQLIDPGEENRNGYVDLFLVHTPASGPVGREILWKALELLKEEGKTIDIGVSNYGVEHIFQMSQYSDIAPVCNQLEIHPFCQQKEVVALCESKGIVVTAYAPIVRNRRSNDATLVAIANKHGKQTTQVMIKWSLQKGYIPLPKSDDKNRMAANMDMDGWQLDNEDMTAIDGLDEGAKGAICPHPLTCP